MLRHAIRPLDDDAGFSLLEALIALAILTGALTTLVRAMAASTITITSAKHVTMATLLAVEKMEQLRSGMIPTAPIAGQDSPVAGEFVRRWWVDPLSTLSPGTWALKVVVTRRLGEAPSEVCLVSIKARKAS